MADETVLNLKEFKEGLITRLPDTAIPDGAFSDVENIDLTERFMPKKVRGHQRYNAAGIASAPIKGAGKYVMANGTAYYIAACNGKLYYSIVGSGTFTAYQIGGADLTIEATADVEMVQYLNSMWLVNGTYPIIKNTGHEASRMIKIYGTTPTAITAGPPQGGKYPLIHQERLFIAGSTDQLNGLYWSEPYEPENWTPEYGINYDYVGKDDGENITGIRSYQGYVYVGKPRNIYRYATQGDITEWQSMRVDTRHGWLYSRCIQELNGMLIYLSSEGVIMFNGNNATIVSEQIRDKILELPQLLTNIRQWLTSTTAEFDTGTYGNIISTSDNQVSLNPQTTLADWQAGINNDVNILIPEGDVSYVETNNLPINIATSGCAVRLGAYIYVLFSSVFYRHSISAGIWETMAAPPATADDGASLATNGTDIFAVRGGLTNTFWKYTVATNNWSVLAVTPVNNGGGASLIFDGTDIYCVHSGFTGSFSKYNISTNAWTAKANIESTIGAGSCSLFLGNLIYLLVGNGTTGARMYSVANNSWSDWVAPSYAAYAGAALTTDGTDMYAIFGNSQQFFQKFTVSAYTWSAKANIPGSVAAGSSLTYDGTYIYGVRGGQTPHFYRYSIRNNSWTLNPYLITKTLTVGFTPAVFGYLAAEIAGTVTFQTKSSATDLSATDWELASGWSTAQANNTQITSTVNPFFRIRMNLSAASKVSRLYAGAIYRSPKKDLGATPTAWGKFVAACAFNGQTITYWLRSAATAGGLDTATWYQQTLDTNITNVAFLQHIQFEIRLNTNLFSQQPIVENVNISYYVGSIFDLGTPCSAVWKNNYWLNIIKPGASINDTVYLYNADGYWLKRTNKNNNVYFISGGDLLSGTSASDGFLRYNDTGTKDDTSEIVSYFTTRNFELINGVKLFRELLITSKSNANWVLSFSVDNGQWIELTINLQGFVATIRRVFTGIIQGQFIKFRIQQTLEDGSFEFHGLSMAWKFLRRLNAL